MLVCCKCCCPKSNKVDNEDAIERSEPLLDKKEGMVVVVPDDAPKNESETEEEPKTSSKPVTKADMLSNSIGKLSITEQLRQMGSFSEAGIVPELSVDKKTSVGRVSITNMLREHSDGFDDAEAELDDPDDDSEVTED